MTYGSFACRRDFLKGIFAAGAAYSLGGFAAQMGSVNGAPMHLFAAKPMKNIRVGVVGCGGRGYHAIRRLCSMPGVTVTEVCDINPKRLSDVRTLLAKHKKQPAREYLGENEWRRLCDSSAVDVVYNTTPWALHVPVALAAMRGGKHVLVEVPSAFTVDECWELVETSEKTHMNCMQLENCCYGEIELLTFNLAKLGMLGEITHAEGAYIHDLRWMSTAKYPANEYWRFDENRLHGGNRYPTHGLVPLCLTMDVNRGDRLEYLVSMDGAQKSMKAYMDAKLKPGDERRNAKMAMSDMNTTLIKTAKGRSIMVQHDVSSPRPYSRIQLVSGTKGTVCDYPFRIALENRLGDGRAHGWRSGKDAAEIRAKHMHPLWKTMREPAKKDNGHGGMDFIMDARWVYCLQQGLPLDTDVYDLAATCCICELTAKSVAGKSQRMDIPDFTRGAWRTNKPMPVVDIDLSKIKFG